MIVSDNRTGRFAQQGALHGWIGDVEAAVWHAGKPHEKTRNLLSADVARHIVTRLIGIDNAYYIEC